MAATARPPVTDAKYAVPVAAFPAHVAPMDVAFYNARQFPPDIAAAPSSPFMARAAAIRAAMTTAIT